VTDVSELQREVEWRRCARSFEYWCNNYVFIRHPAQGKILFELRQAQIDTVEVIQSRQNTLVLKARQIGYSTLMAVYSLWVCLFQDDRPIIFLSKTEREATSLLYKSKYAYKHLPEWMRDRGPQLLTDHVMKMPFDNDSSITSMPSKSEPARGESVWLVIVDEWAFLENPEDAWASIEPIADVGGQVVGLSTARGYGNFFHDMWVRATTGVNDFVPLFYPWSAGDRDDDWYAAKKAALPEWQLHQEYPRNAEEAFIKSGNPVFDIELLQSIEPWEPLRGHLSPLNSIRTVQYQEGANGPLSVFQAPEPFTSYVVGADTAEGLEHGDYSSAHVVRVDDGLVVATWHGHIDPDLFGNQLAMLGFWYNAALLGVESNNHGLTTLKSLQRLHYPRLYRQRRLGAKRDTQTDKLGWTTHKASKPLLIDELNMELRHGHVDLHCAKTVAELKTYVRDPDGKMHGSPFDDRVISLGIANQMRAYAHTPEYMVPEDSYMTFDWWADLAEHGEGGPSEDWVIGASTS
jgi:hypothetical protein